MNTLDPSDFDLDCEQEPWNTVEVATSTTTCGSNRAGGHTRTTQQTHESHERSAPQSSADDYAACFSSNCGRCLRPRRVQILGRPSRKPERLSRKQP